MSMKRFFMVTFLVMAVFSCVASCAPEEPVGKPEQGSPVLPDGGGEVGDGSGDAGGGEEEERPVGNGLVVKIGGVVFTATLDENEAAKAFRAMLPMSVRMSEQGGNEKYCFLPERLPVKASNVGSILNGDLMVWGSDCLVLFYRTFQTSYRYTRLGKIDRPEGLAAAVGNGEVTVRFEVAE